MRGKIDEVKEHYERFADLYLHDNYKIGVRTRIAREVLGPVVNSTVLDVGCGDGSVSIQFLRDDNELTLLDLSSAMLEKARSNVPAEYRSRVRYVNSALLSHHAPAQYDVVICMGVLAYVESVEETIRHLSDLLKPGGRCVLELSDYQALSTKVLYLYYAARRSLSDERGRPPGLNKNTSRDVLRMAARCGLAFIGQRRHLLLLPGMGRLPGPWLLKYDLFVLNHSVLSRHGSEAILLFKKQ